MKTAVILSIVVSGIMFSGFACNRPKQQGESCAVSRPTQQTQQVSPTSIMWQNQPATQEVKVEADSNAVKKDKE